MVFTLFLCFALIFSCFAVLCFALLFFLFFLFFCLFASPQVLEGDGVGGNRGEELLVPARTTSTSAFFVKANAMLQWRFRVAAHDIGFAIRLRVQVLE
jgi:hypothetical protein